MYKFWIKNGKEKKFCRIESKEKLEHLVMIYAVRGLTPIQTIDRMEQREVMDYIESDLSLEEYCVDEHKVKGQTDLSNATKYTLDIIISDLTHLTRDRLEMFEELMMNNPNLKLRYEQQQKGEILNSVSNPKGKK